MKIGLLIEGGIDEDILRPVLSQVLDAEMPLFHGHATEEQFFTVPFPPRGYGKITENLRFLIQVYQDAEERQQIGCDFFVIVHDSRKTESIRKEVIALLRQAPHLPAVYGLAIQEIEAWVLGDISHINKKVFQVSPEPELPEKPEKDPDPKGTLTRLFIWPSTAIEYDCWNRECARLVAPHIRYQQVASHCPRGFRPLLRDFKKRIGQMDR